MNSKLHILELIIQHKVKINDKSKRRWNFNETEINFINLIICGLEVIFHLYIVTF